MKKIKGNTMFGIGLMIFSVTLLLQNMFDWNEGMIHSLVRVIYVFSLGLEILGSMKICKEKNQDK